MRRIKEENVEAGVDILSETDGKGTLYGSLKIDESGCCRVYR